MRIEVSEDFLNTRRWIYFEDGWACEMSNKDFKSLIADPKIDLRTNLLNIIESNKLFLAPILIFNVVLIWLVLHFAIPQLTERASYHLSLVNTASNDKRTLRTLDRRQFATSNLPLAEQKRLQLLFQQYLKKSQHKNKDKRDIFHYRLLFRNTPNLGANAFGLPSGAIIITDQLIRLSRSDKQLMAIIAHEVGHIRKRHATKSRLNTSTSMLIYGHLLHHSQVLSHLSFITPDILLNYQYTQQEEMEADRFALKFLRANRINLKVFKHSLVNLKRYSKGHNAVFYHNRFKTIKNKNPKVNYFKTHPYYHDRLSLIKKVLKKDARKKRQRRKRRRNRYRRRTKRR